jgi:hypothetical protein
VESVVLSALVPVESVVLSALVPVESVVLSALVPVESVVLSALVPVESVVVAPAPDVVPPDPDAVPPVPGTPVPEVPDVGVVDEDGDVAAGEAPAFVVTPDGAANEREPGTEPGIGTRSTGWTDAAGWWSRTAPVDAGTAMPMPAAITPTATALPTAPAGVNRGLNHARAWRADPAANRTGRANARNIRRRNTTSRPESTPAPPSGPANEANSRFSDCRARHRSVSTAATPTPSSSAIRWYDQPDSSRSFSTR